MADYPALPLWTDAYLADTRHLTTVQHGAYLLLLMEAWRRPTCTLPDDDRLLARLTGLRLSDWRRQKPVVMAFFRYDKRSREWRQKRLSAERKYVVDRSRKQRDNAAKRWNSTKKDHATAMPNQCQTDAPTPTPTPTPSGVDSVHPATSATPPDISENPATSRARDAPNGSSGGASRHSGGQRGNGMYDAQPNRDAYAVQQLVPYLPGRDDAERWAVAMKAEDPKAKGHQAAVTACLKAARQAGVGWVSPERRRG